MSSTLCYNRRELGVPSFHYNRQTARKSIIGLQTSDLRNNSIRASHAPPIVKKLLYRNLTSISYHFLYEITSAGRTHTVICYRLQWLTYKSTVYILIYPSHQQQRRNKTRSKSHLKAVGKQKAKLFLLRGLSHKSIFPFSLIAVTTF